MKALILYFSGTGNTEYVAKKISRILNELQVASEMHSIEEKYIINPNNLDMLILGCPKYYEYPVLDFIKYLKNTLPHSNKTIPAMIYCTQAGPLITDFKKIERILKTKNYNLTVERSIPLANNFTILKMFPPTKDEKLEINLDNLDKDLKPLLSNFMKGQLIKENPNIVLRILCYLSAIIFTPIFAHFAVKFSTSFSCTNCGLCVKKCPRQNITLHNNKIKFNNKCIFCMRCIHSCPVHAILYNNKECTRYKRIIEKK
jgi:ferredoxin/flavodoxin